MKKRVLLLGSITGLLYLLYFGLQLFFSIQAPPSDLLLSTVARNRSQVLDRAGDPLSYTYDNKFNFHNQLSLSKIPEFLQIAFIEAEDRRFYSHSGVDWWARLGALYQNLKAGRIVRGASTISEQVIRLVHPRERTVSARLLEGIEAKELEKNVSKAELLEFYLNQIPYARRRTWGSGSLIYVF